MNNIDLIKEDYNIGDAIRLSCSLGVKEGFIVAFYNNRIKIQPHDSSKKPISLLDTDIVTWEDGENPQLGDDDNDNNSNKKESNSNTISVNTNPIDIINTTDQSKIENSIDTITSYNAESLEYKVGDVVSKHVLDQWRREKDRQENKIAIKKAKKENKNSSKETRTFTSLSDLASLDSVVESRKRDATNVVREMGEIIRCGHGTFGFIHDNKTGEECYFHYSELIDFDKSNPLSLIGQYVVYTRGRNYSGPIAFSIHKPDTVENIVSLAKAKYDEGQKRTAYELVNHILSNYPDSYLANQALRYFSTTKLKNHGQNKRSTINDENDYLYYKKARDYDYEKDYPKAIEFYKKAIEANQKVESAIKDLGMLYISLYTKSEDSKTRENYFYEARTLMETYGNKLQRNGVNLNWLENFYYAIRDFENFKVVANELLSSLNVRTDGPRCVFLLNKLAAVLIKEGDTQEARELLNKALDIYPASTGAAKLLDIIDDPNSIIENRIEEEIKSLDSEIETFYGGLSPFIEDTLNNFQEKDYAGVKAKDFGNFTKKTLKGVRDFIKTFDDPRFAGRPSDRARYLLTEGKLMLLLEPDNTFELRSVMARYCNDMAKVHINNSSPTDVIRFYYNEAFALVNDYSATVTQLTYYLLTNIYDCKRLSEEMNKSIAVDVALGDVLSNTMDQKKWESILTMFLYNKEIFFQIVNKLYNNKEFKKKSISALKSFGIETSEKLSLEEYQKAWNRARERRLGDYRTTIASLKSITATSNIEELSIRLSENLKNYKRDWMCSLDLSRLTYIMNTVAPALDKYHKAEGFRNKQLNCREVENLINQMIDEIVNKPTKLSYEAILPLLETVKQIVDKSFDDFLVASKPIPKIFLLRTESIVNQLVVPLQIEVSIDKDSSPIYDLDLKIINTQDIQIVSGDDSTTFLGLIEGGDTHIFKPLVKVSDYVIKNKAIAFDVECVYFNNGIKESKKASLSLHLYNPEEFVPIPNPYAPVAESGPLAADSKMFFGQKEYIKRVVDTIIESPSKQVIIYGQKRSGKSSVLNQVQHELTEAGAFCVQFSMGTIVRDISEFAFYYKILLEIRKSLLGLRDEGINAPLLEIPSRMDFQKEDPFNPAESFINYMRLFRKECKKTEGWEKKRLVVLIDEFTYMYGAIKMHKISPTIMMQWKAVTQDEQAQFSVVLVGQDVVPAFKQEPYARNAFGVIKDLRLTYLKKEDAKDLITQPIIDNGNSRYNDKAVELIMDYTACNPYYLQIFCSHLVDYMNDKRYNTVTEADVLDVASELISGINALGKARFENLLSSGETDKEDDIAGVEVDEAIKKYTDDEVEEVLKAVAKASSTKVWAVRSDIRTSLDVTVEDGVLIQLYDRDVIDKKEDNYYKIKVRLYKEWLLKH